MQIVKYQFNKKCMFDMCQNKADYSLNTGSNLQLIFCKECLSKLKTILKTRNGEQNEKTGNK